MHIQRSNFLHSFILIVCRSIVVFMVRGLVSGLLFPYALFPVKSLKAYELFSLLWRTIERLSLLDFKILSVTCDGAKCNRKMFAMHSLVEDGIIFKTPNIYNMSGDIFFLRPPSFIEDRKKLLS